MVLLEQTVAKACGNSSTSSEYGRAYSRLARRYGTGGRILEGMKDSIWTCCSVTFDHFCSFPFKKNPIQADVALANGEDTTEFGNRYRPLHYAAYQGHLAICQLLVQNGAKVGELILYLQSKEEK